MKDGTSKEQVDQFTKDLRAPGAFPPQDWWVITLTVLCKISI